MPCDSVIEMTVEMGANVDTTLLADALRKLGYGPKRQADGSITFGSANGYRLSGKFHNGKLDVRTTGTSYRDAINAIKRSYAYETVMSAARRNGWMASQDGKTEADGTQRLTVSVLRSG